MEMHVENNKEILRRLANDDDGAFRIIYERYRRIVYIKATKHVDCAGFAYDVVQEIFIKIWMHRSELYLVDNFDAYLQTMLRHYLINNFKNKSVKSSYLKYTTEVNTFAEAGRVSDPAIFREISRLHSQAIESLTPQQKKVYVMGKEAGLKYKEIALQLKISPQTVKEYMSEAMISVRKFLVQYKYGREVEC